MDNETKLTLHGLQQHYVKLQDKEKNRKLFDLMDALEFNQVWPPRLSMCLCVYASVIPILLCLCVCVCVCVCVLVCTCVCMCVCR